MNVDKKVIDRIRKLLALAKDGAATEAEAELAMSMAQEQMAAHNLNMAIFEAGGGAQEGRAREFARRPLLYVWKRDLLKAIAKTNFCYLDIHSSLKGYDIIGRQSNIAAAHHVFEYLTQTIERLLVNEVGKSPQARYSRYSHSFRMGAACKLIDRLDKRHEDFLARQEREAREEKARAQHPASATKNAVVVVMRDYWQDEQDLNNDLRNGWEPGTTSRRRAENLAKYEAKRREDEAKRLAIIAAEPDINESLAYYMSRGWSREQAVDLLGLNRKPETPAQARRREERENRAADRQREADERRHEREASKIDRTGFSSGVSAAEGINLDDQITKSTTRKIR